VIRIVGNGCFYDENELKVLFGSVVVEVRFVNPSLMTFVVPLTPLAEGVKNKQSFSRSPLFLISLISFISFFFFQHELFVSLIHQGKPLHATAIPFTLNSMVESFLYLFICLLIFDISL
jgi:hypothetical protein